MKSMCLEFLGTRLHSTGAVEPLGNWYLFIASDPLPRNFEVPLLKASISR